MTYYTGTISTGQDADFASAIHAGLLANGYSRVDIQVISTRTHWVYKNPAANNSSGKDWYFDLGFSTTGFAGITLRPMEDYDAVNHLAIRGIVALVTFSTVEQTYYTRYGTSGFSLEHANWLSSNNNFQFTTQAASYGYYLSITGECVTGFTSANPQFSYSGLITLSAGNISAQGTSALPLVCFGGGIFYQTRYPKAGPTMTYQSPWGSVLRTMSLNGPAWPVASPLLSSPDFIPLETMPSNTFLANTTTIYFYHGWLKNIYALIVDTTVGRGDTIQDTGGATYTINGQASSGPAYCVKQV